PVSVAVLLSVAAIQRGDDRRPKAVFAAAAVALFFACLAEWMVRLSIFGEFNLMFGEFDVGFPCAVALWHTGIFLLFVFIPYVYTRQRVWAWGMAAVAAPLQFFFVHWWLIDRTGSAMGRSIPYKGCLPQGWLWMPTLAFALPAAVGVWYLLKKES